jgi:hypothetical protein
LARVSGGDSASLQLYLDGKIPLSVYRQEKSTEDAKKAKILATERIKKEVLEKIRLLDSADIAEIITTSVAFLAKRA